LVHQIIKKREEFGAFYTLYDELRDDANMFLNYFRILVAEHKCMWNVLLVF